MKRFSFFLLCFLALCLPVRAGGAEEQRECANILAAARLAPDAPLSEEGLALLLPGADLSAVPALTRAGFCEILQRYLLDNDLILPQSCSVDAADLDWSVPCHTSAEYILRGGVMSTDESNSFRPLEPITNGEAALAVGRLRALSRPFQSGQPASSLPETEPLNDAVLEECCMLGHSNVVGLDLSVPTGLDIIAKVGVSAQYFLSDRDLSFGRNGQGCAADGLQLRRYRSIYLMLGTNDMVQGREATAEFEESIRTIVELIRYYQPQAALCILSITPFGVDIPQYTEEITLFNQTLKSISRDYGISYLDIYTPLATRSGGNIPELARQDGYHYNAEGYERILDAMLRHPLPSP